ncbi:MULTISPECIES: hypothetical protein [unclassified Aminobacter]|uniref:hypothetical protein n=1 Tax=unclassified Aminobacter TaxID=2644704 RepID=UPI000466C4D1|nr:MULTISPECIES: hypothetical protein [unclassified Aminobacter]TWH23333.1 hypothetical protein L611_000900000080 [Aminobacter sp. J15]
MSEFNRMTLVAAAEVVSDFHSHSDLDVLAVQWGISDRCGGSSKAARVASLSRTAIDEEIEVYTEAGVVDLKRALVETAIKAPDNVKRSQSWRKLTAGLRFDGFEIVETRTEIKPAHPWEQPRTQKRIDLVRMLPDDVPELAFREAESEIVALLDRHGFHVAKGHLKQAMAAFQRGEWASSNGALRNFYESYLNEVAERLGCAPEKDSQAKRNFLGGGVQPPFLLADYNEWDGQKTQYVQALMNRMHPHGGHPGLSEEDDATFRLQISLITARLFLRRFDARVR